MSQKNLYLFTVRPTQGIAIPPSQRVQVVLAEEQHSAMRQALSDYSRDTGYVGQVDWKFDGLLRPEDARSQMTEMLGVGPLSAIVSANALAYVASEYAGVLTPEEIAALKSSSVKIERDALKFLTE